MILRMNKYFFKNIFILFLFFQNISAKNIKINSKQFKIIIEKQFSKKNMPKLLGSRLYKNKNINSIQIDIQNTTSDINNTIYLSFKSLNNLSNIYKNSINELIVIIHNNNDIPLVIRAENKCLNKFFNNLNQNKTDWKNNCLNIGTL